MAELGGQTLPVIGLGPIGAEVARLGAAFGMRVIGVNRTSRSAIRDIEAVHPTHSLANLPAADAVIVTHGR